MNVDEYMALKAQEESKVKEPDQPADKPVEEEKKQAEPTPEPKEEIKEEPKKEEEVKTNKLHIDGIGDVDIDEIKEWKNGYLRQTDYTKKTQSLANQKKEVEDAVEVYNYLKSNPDVAKRLAEGDTITKDEKKIVSKVDPNMQNMSALTQQIEMLTLRMEIQDLESKYKDFDVREVLSKAQEDGIDDLEKAYKLVKAEKVMNTPQQEVDIDALRKQIKSELLDEMKKEKIVTQSIISSNDKAPPSQAQEDTHTEKELKIMKAFNMTKEDWKKW